jgi:hypothetical protein
MPAYPQAADSELPTTGQWVPLGGYHLGISWVPDAEAVQNGLGPNDDLTALPHHPINTCYRNSLLAALFNVAPFVSFLKRVHDQGVPKTVMYSMLLRVFEYHRNIGREKPARRAAGLLNATNQFWDLFDKTAVTTDDPAKSGSSASWSEYCSSQGERFNQHSNNPGIKENEMHDSNELFTWMMDRLVFAELGNNMIDTRNGM